MAYMNEDEYVQSVIESELKNKFESTKESLLKKLFEAKSEKEYDKYQEKLLRIEKEYNKDIEDLYKETKEKVKGNSDPARYVVVQHNLKAEDDNDFYVYIKNLKAAINEYLLNIFDKEKTDVLDSKNTVTQNTSQKICATEENLEVDTKEQCKSDQDECNTISQHGPFSQVENSVLKLECQKFIEADIQEDSEYYKNITKILYLIYEHQSSGSYSYQNLSIPLQIYSILFEYQKDCVKWLYTHFVKRQGCILADEMGLGKTLQVIAFLSSMIISQKIKNILIVVPSTVLNQWILEWKKFFPFIRIFVLHKTYTKDIQRLKKSILQPNKVLIISYDGFKNEIKFLQNLDFAYIVLDEGHKIKNKNSGISKTLKKFCYGSRSGVKPKKHDSFIDLSDSYASDYIHKIVLTGTPIQNNLQELWNIFDFVNPKILGSLTDFVEEFEDPIKKGGYSNASLHNIEQAYKTAVFLKSSIEPYILRRLKVHVAKQLPSKVDKIMFCELTKKQEVMYKKVLDSDLVYKILLGKVNCLSGLMTLRKIINHPKQYENTKNYDLNTDKISLNFNYDSIDESQGFCEEEIISSSGKMIKLDMLLKEWKQEKKKVLIFTQFVDMLKILEVFCCFSGYSYLKMDGTTTLKTRVDYINQFNNNKDIFIFLLTTKVGGLGLNLVGASRIIIYDPDWNPSTDTQAKERAWRYGQKESVETYRFVTINTLEEKIYKRQIFKSHLSDKILKDPKSTKLFEKDDLNDLFTYFKDSSNRDKTVDVATEETNEENKFESELVTKLDEKTKTKYEEVKTQLEKLCSKVFLDDAEMIEFIRLRDDINE